MTGMNGEAMAWLEARGLDVELADKLGLHSEQYHARNVSGDALVYPFIREGKVVGSKWRPMPFKEGGPRFWWSKGDEHCAYNEDCLRDDSLIDQPVVITEGQDDCIAALQSGIQRVISVPDGAPEKPIEDLSDSIKYKWLDDIFHLLKLNRTPAGIILAVDGDSAGAALMHDLAVKLGKSRCKFITYPKAKSPEQRGRERLKDLNEALEDYGARGVREVIARAQFLKVSGVFKLSELPPLPDQEIFDIGFEALGDHLRLRLGDMSVWTGIGGYGKTTLLNDLLNRVVKQYGIRVAWASFEQDPQRDHRRAFRSWYWEDWEWKLTEAQRAEADAWIDNHHRFLVPDEDEDASLDWVLDRLEAAVVQHGCKVCVIDPFNEIDHCKGPGESDVDYINRAVRTFRRFARRFQIHLIIVAHPTKMPRLENGTYMMPGLLDVSGGAVWRNKATQGIVVHLIDKDTTMVKVDKVRYRDILGTPGSVLMQFIMQTRHFVETERNVEDRPQPAPARRRKAVHPL